MPQDNKAERPTVSFDELAYSNMLVVQALVELLAEKSLLSSDEVRDRVQRLRRETQVHATSVTSQAAPEAQVPRMAVVTIEDLVSANMVAVEALLALLVEKAFLTRTEMEELIAELKRKASKTLVRKK